MAENTQVRRIIVTADVKANRDLMNISKQLGDVSKSTSKLSTDFASFRNVFNTIIGASFLGIGIRQITDLSDSMQTLNSRITILTGSSAGAQIAMAGILKTANNTKTSIDSLATIYARLSASTSESGFSGEQLLDVTEALQNSFRLSGATTAEATATTIQLSQGFAAGALRGQELRSVLEQNVVFAKLLRKEFGQNIFKVAESGALTTDKVFKLLLKSQVSLREDAEKLGQTFDQSVTVALNKAKDALFKFNQAFDVSGKFAAFIDTLEQKSKVILVVLGGVAAVVGGLVAFFFGAPIAAAIGALSAFQLALIGVGVAATSLVAIFDNFDIEKFVEPFLTFSNSVKNQGLSKAIFDISVSTEALAKSADKAVVPFTLISNELFKESKNRGGSFVQDLGLVSAALDEFNANALLSPLATEIPKTKSGGGGLPELLDTLDKATASLNRQLKAGKITNEQYFASLKSFEIKFLNEDFEKGKLNLTEFNKKLKDLDMKSLEAAFDRGAISADMFRQSVLAIKMGELNKELETGKKSLVEYYIELGKIDSKLGLGGSILVGTAEAIDGLGTMATNVSSIMKNAFSSLEDALFEATKSGTLNFEKFTQSVLDDITRMIIRLQVIAPLVQGLMGFAGGLSFGSAAAAPGVGSVGQTGGPVALKGGGMMDGGYSFASSGQPITNMSSGYAAMSMGSSPVEVNIINNSDTEISTKSSTGPGGQNVLDVLITNKVRDGIATGAFDKSFQSNYGIKRKGS
jgi:lambda family phage tail tape measure protein